MGLIKGTASKKLFGVIFKTDEDNGYNNKELKTLIIVNANTKKYAKTKAYRKMESKEMNTDDLWYYHEIIDIEDENSINTEEFHNVFKYITV